MGRTVKISELRLFDVFRHNGLSWVKVTNGVCLINLGHVVTPSADHDVVLLGHMEFKEEAAAG